MVSYPVRAFYPYGIFWGTTFIQVVYKYSSEYKSMKIDPYKHEERYHNWKANLNGFLPKISKTNSKIILNYVFDMENGLNVSSTNKKGARSYARLNNIRQRLTSFCIKLEKRYELNNITKITEEQLFDFFTKIRNGKIKTDKGKIYKSVGDYIKVFKAFWHWHQKVMRKRKIEVEDITIDLDTSSEKPKWVYLDEKQFRKLCSYAKYEVKVLMMFLFDSGIRSPTELINIKVPDLSEDCKKLNIRDEISKTFGRKINLMLCSELLKEYIKNKELNSNNYLFPISPSSTNRYLKNLAKKVFGDKTSQAGEIYSNLTMYDFRHISCCYWLPKYKSESALKYRFGWKKSNKIHYYSELLGMKDTIAEEDLLDDVTKTELDKRLTKSERQNTILKERINNMENQMKKILGLVDGMVEKVKD